MKRNTTLALAVALVLGAGTALAQPPYGGMGGGGPGAGPCAEQAGPMAGQWGGPGKHRGDPGARMTQRLENLKAELGLSAEQQPAWTAFANAVNEQIAAMQAHRAQMREQAAVTAPERMKSRIAFMQERAASMGKVQQAFEELYAKLTPEQKAKADRTARRMPF